MNFDRAADPKPISAELAVKRGVHLVNWPVRLIIAVGFAAAYLARNAMPTSSFVLALAAIAAAWLWWSFYIPQWRTWALRSGADPEELQYLGESASLVWPPGSFFEKTEIRRNKA